MLKSRFYRLLCFWLLPLWVLWQLSWGLAFQYLIDYQRAPVALLISSKLAIEVGFFFLGAWLLKARMQGGAVFQLALLMGVLALGLYTLFHWGRGLLP